MGGHGRYLVTSTTGDPEALLGFEGVAPGDEVAIDNRDFIAYGFYYRHHIINDDLCIDGRPIFEQHTLGDPSTWSGDDFTARPKSKMILVQHAHDPYVWTNDMIEYDAKVRDNLGEETSDLYRLYWTERAEHVFPPMKASSGDPPMHEVRFINYTPIIEQAIHDLISWAEEGVPPPADTRYSTSPQRALLLPPTAVERRGIQPIIQATANGGVRADVKVGEPVTFDVDAQAPPNTGTIVSVEWDFDGTGTWPYECPGIDGTADAVRTTTTHAYVAAGTYYATARVRSHRDGDRDAAGRQLPNHSRVRVVVT
jgi:hypothetical protein